MQQIFICIIVILIISVVWVSCSKKNEVASLSLNNTLPASINNIVTTVIIDAPKKYGATIKTGATPPTLNGIYLIHPDLYIFDNSGGSFEDAIFDDYKYKFSNQNNGSYVIRVDYKDINDNTAPVLADSTTTLVSGDKNFFTIFSQFTTAKNGVNYNLLHVLSGEVGSRGIKNFQNSTYLHSKNSDHNGYVETRGAIRVFIDPEFFS
jgi:hypothetical protein